MKKNTTTFEKSLECKRQLFHALFGTVLVLLFYFNILQGGIFFLLIVAGTTIHLCWKDGANPIIAWFFRHFERKGGKGEGALWYCVGCFVTIALFPKAIALAAILILALGDSVSHYVGRFYGRIPHPLNKQKNIEGMIAGTAVAGMSAIFFVPVLNAFLAAVITMNIEVREWTIGKWKIDDNFIIPVTAGIILFLLDL